MNKGSAIISILVAFVGGLAIGHITAKSTSGGGEVAEEAKLDDKATAAVAEAAGDVERLRVPVTEAQPVKGPENAPVTIVEFSDFQCPFCNKVVPTLERIEKEYGDKVRMVWRNNPLPMHQDAPRAAQAAMEAFDQGGDEKFWKMHDILFDNQKALKKKDLVGYAKKIGLDTAEFKKALENKEHQSQVKKDQKLAQKLGASGTPAFFINGRKLMGAQPFNKFKSVIEDELSRTDKMIGAGVPKSKLYGQLMENAKAKPGKDKDKKKRAKKKRPDPNAVYKVPLKGNEPMKGPKNALVTIVEFSDFQCPFCKRAVSTVEKVMDKYGNDVRLVWKNNPLPFHNNAMPSAIAAMEAYEQKGDKAFWKMHDLLFENQKSLSRDTILKLGKKVGLNQAQLKRALDNQEHKERIKKEQKLARSLGASGTPAFFINGRNLRGAQPMQAFERVIDEELKKAKKKVKGGTPKAKVYEETIKDGATEPQFIKPEGGSKGKGGKKKAKEYDIPVPSDAPRRGAANPKVVIQEFSDFQCPFCNKVRSTLKKVMDEYGDKVSIVWRNYPLPMHNDAPMAHQAAWEVYKQAGDEKFWEYHDLLFDNQKNLKKDNLVKLAKQVGGINTSKLEKALENKTHKSRIQEDKKAISKAGAKIGTPSFFVEGKLIQGARPFSAFKSKIEEALEAS